MTISVFTRGAILELFFGRAWTSWSLCRSPGETLASILIELLARKQDNAVTIQTFQFLQPLVLLKALFVWGCVGEPRTPGVLLCDVIEKMHEIYFMFHTKFHNFK